MDRHVPARRRVVRTLAGALTVSALLAPAAFARPAPEDAFGSNRAGSIPTLPDSSRAPAPTVTRTLDDGFDVGSAAIGAGGAGAVLVLAGAAAVARSRRPTGFVH